MNHLPRKPAVGGTPIIDSAPTAKAPIVHGIFRPTPSIPLTSSTWAPIWSEPAAKNSVIFETAWAAIWRAAPRMASGVNSATPRTT